MSIQKYIKKFSKAKILVIGDIMLDKYLKGKIDRICPEAPVPIVHVKKEKLVPGGAANTANNVVSYGAKCYLVGFIGDDISGKILKKILDVKGINTDGLITWKNSTIQKIRVMSKNQQLLRIDYEEKQKNNQVGEMLAFIESKLNEIDLIIVSDYAKGVMCLELMEGLKKFGKKIIVDPKPCNAKMYSNVFLIKPNKKEAEEILAIKFENDSDINLAGQKLSCELNSNILITRGAEGMSLFENKEISYIPTQAKEVYDVTGAGDSVLATLGVALASGANLKEATTLANHAAGIVVGKIGTATLSVQELLKVFECEKGKVKSFLEIQNECERLRCEGKKIVFTNGCFDVLHVGHTRLLQKAKSFGDVLVLGLDTDSSIKKLKGENRPINNEKERAELLSALNCVDYIVFFENGNPLSLIKHIIPHVQVKGADYADKEIIGKGFVEQNGGRVELVELVEGKSSTKIIEKIKSE